jgi:dinuclear metal center YbgI/SA1388 family protein
MIKQSILSILRSWAPEDSAESWDNVGLQLDTKRDVKRVAIVLEINLDTWDILKKYDYDLIISHHPIIFKPLSQIGHDDWTHEVIRYLIQHDIGFYVSHTNLDCAPNGVSSALANQFNLSPDRVTDLHDGYGTVFHFNTAVSVSDFDQATPVIAQIIPDDLSIHSIAFLGGSGKSFTNKVVDDGIDFYVTGELGYHDIQYLRQQKKGVFLLGHYQSEVFILDDIKDKLSNLEIEIDIIK